VTGWDLPGIGGLSRAYLSGQLTPSAVLDDTLARIATVDKELSSFVAIDADRAHRAAAAADAELKSARWRGPLHGVPIAVKELFPARAPDYGEDVRHRLEGGRSIDLGAYFAACDRRRHLVAALDDALASVDVLLTPVNPGTPPQRSDPDHVIAPDGTRQPFRDVIMGYTVPQNLAGVPAVTICAGADELGLPCGIQLTAARGHELSALQLAEVLDREMRDRGSGTW